MKLDPCPWCGDEPNVMEWLNYDTSFMKDCHMVRVWCCWADMICHKEDAETNWNWSKQNGS